MEAPRPMSNEATTATTDASTDKKMGAHEAQGWDLEGNYHAAWDVEATRYDWDEKERYRGIKGLDGSMV